jgi:uncharacterized protein with FMN-binding domain
MKRTSRLCALCASLALCAMLAGCAATGVIEGDDLAKNLSVRKDSFASVPDGLYKGTGTTGVPAGTVVAYRKVSVTVRVVSGAVADIEITEPKALDKEEKLATLEKRVIAKNGLDVDVVSGATYSGMAYLKAIEKAVFK